jgi:hypothetical protein
MKKILIDGCQLMLQLAVQPLDNVCAAFHVVPPQAILVPYNCE